MDNLSLPRRVLPAAGLFLLAPIVAEYLLGDLPITFLIALVVMAPLYGGAALLIREVTRRLGRGVPTMLVLGTAYGLLEEGLVTQSLFNPDYAGIRLLDPAFVPALGIGGSWTVFVLMLHAVWSTTVPILLVEACVPDRRTRPWLGTPGLVVTTVLFVLGAVATGAQQRGTYPFTASTAQLLTSAALAVALVVLAVQLPRLTGDLPGRVPPPWLPAAGVLVLGVLFMRSALGDGWTNVALTLALDALVAGALVRWSRRAVWTPLHTLAVAAGAVAVYAVQTFMKPTMIPTPPAIDLLSDAVFTAVAFAIVVVGVTRLRHAAHHTEIDPAAPIRR